MEVVSPERTRVKAHLHGEAGDADDAEPLTQRASGFKSWGRGGSDA